MLAPPCTIKKRIEALEVCFSFQFDYIHRLKPLRQQPLQVTQVAHPYLQMRCHNALSISLISK